MTKIYCWWLATLQGCGFEVWYGMRTDESSERAKRYKAKISDELYPPHEVMPSKYPKYLEKMGVMFRLPIVDWTTQEVLDYLDGDEHPHYEWRDRMGCHPCFAAGDAAKERDFEYDSFGHQQYITAIELGNGIGKSVFTSKGGKERHPEADSQGCSICSI